MPAKRKPMKKMPMKQMGGSGQDAPYKPGKPKAKPKPGYNKPPRGRWG